MEDVVFICSVGGSPEPIRASINQQRPRYVIYVASPESRQTIRKEIESKLEWRDDIKDTHTITLSDYQDLLACVKDMRSGIAVGLRDMGLPEETLLIADITGGTKVMSAALTLVMMEYQHSRFTYVGGDVRGKDGLGVVESGHEKILKRDNPWEVMALREVQALANAFNRGDFAAAHGMAKELAEKIPDKKNFYGGLADLTESCLLWDAFSHDTALKKMRQALGRLEPFSTRNAPLLTVLRNFQGVLAVLEEVQKDAQRLRSPSTPLGEDCGHAYLCDLLANALRRGNAGRYDDAVARLYSAIEKGAKIRLLTHYRIDNSKIAPEQLPEHLPEELRQTLLSQGEKNGVIRTGLQHSFQLLAAIGDSLGTAYLTQETPLLHALEARNNSLLAHGYVPVREKDYQRLRDAAFGILDIAKERLPHIPVLDWKSLLL